MVSSYSDSEMTMAEVISAMHMRNSSTCHRAAVMDCAFSDSKHVSSGGLICGCGSEWPRGHGDGWANGCMQVQPGDTDREVAGAA